jgi:hypothetical protein
MREVKQVEQIPVCSSDSGYVDGVADGYRSKKRRCCSRTSETMGLGRATLARFIDGNELPTAKSVIHDA